MSQPEAVALLTTEVMDRAALSMAHKFRLVRDDGTVKCINDHCDGDATLPTLECGRCRDWRRRA
jgi:hypothetical protein